MVATFVESESQQHFRCNFASHKQTMTECGSVCVRVKCSLTLSTCLSNELALQQNVRQDRKIQAQRDLHCCSACARCIDAWSCGQSNVYVSQSICLCPARSSPHEALSRLQVLEQMYGQLVSGQGGRMHTLMSKCFTRTHPPTNPGPLQVCSRHTKPGSASSMRRGS